MVELDITPEMIDAALRKEPLPPMKTLLAQSEKQSKKQSENNSGVEECTKTAGAISAKQGCCCQCGRRKSQY